MNELTVALHFINVASYVLVGFTVLGLGALIVVEAKH